jgi:hypothetical protein
MDRGRRLLEHGHSLIRAGENANGTHNSNILTEGHLMDQPIFRRSNGQHLNSADVARRDNYISDLAKFWMYFNSSFTDVFAYK